MSTKPIPQKNMARIMKDKRAISLSPLIDEGIYVLHDENDVTVSRVIIIGPDDTPYAKGMYCFEIEFPPNYPYSPLKAKFKTNDGRTRLHPNFYSNGKVCVSVIGTWAGPGWSSCQTFASVLLTFRSLMIENPLWQEPGYNNEKSSRITSYNEVITYENLRIGILQMLTSPPTGFEGFVPIMREHYLRNYDWLVTKYSDMLNERQFDKEGNDIGTKYEGKVLTGPSIYNFSVKCQLAKLLNKMGDMVITLQSESIECNDCLTSLLAYIPSDQPITYRNLVMATKDTDNIQNQFDVLLNLLQLRGMIHQVGPGKLIKVTT